MYESKGPQNPPQEENERLDIKVLLADDHPNVLIASSRFLKSMGCTVETVTNGQELLDKLETDVYDLVISDNNMPIMTGIQALEIIRASDKLKHLPVIVNTGDSNVKEKIEQLGGIYLQKPFEIDEPERTVREIIKKHTA